MSRTVLAEVEGFTPVIDSLAKQHGLFRAAVFGAIWRYCQMRDGVCKATLEAIGTDLGIDKASVQRHAEALVRDGYLEDLTPDLRNRPHVYRDTGKAGLRIQIAATVKDWKAAPAGPAPAGPDVAQGNATLQSATSRLPVQRHVAESQLSDSKKKDLKRGKIDSAPPEPAGDGTKAIQAAYEDLLGYKLDDWKAGEASAAKAIGEKYTADQLRAAYAHYKKDSFWKDKRLRLAKMAELLPEYLRGPGRSAGQPAGPNGSGPRPGQPGLVTDAKGIQRVALTPAQEAIRAEMEKRNAQAH